jgi:hypothetical protein
MPGGYSFGTLEEITSGCKEEGASCGPLHGFAVVVVVNCL